MTADRYAELREALAAGPTPGPWKEAGRVAAHGEAIRIRSVNIIERGYEIADVIDANGYPSNTANAALIAACDPGTIAALLAERDAAAEEWTKAADRHPAPHARYEVRRADLGTFVATPCYGLHAPWWVPLVADVFAPGAIAFDFDDADEWRPFCAAPVAKERP